MCGNPVGRHTFSTRLSSSVMFSCGGLIPVVWRWYSMLPIFHLEFAAFLACHPFSWVYWVVHMWAFPDIRERNFHDELDELKARSWKRDNDRFGMWVEKGIYIRNVKGYKYRWNCRESKGRKQRQRQLRKLDTKDGVWASTQRGASRYCAEEPSNFTIWRRHISHDMRQSVLLCQHSYMFIKILF